MDQPLVSIIIPVYKVEKYLRRCLESVKNQTYKNIEVILVDDGSPDGCPQICDEYAANDPRFHVIHKENGGVSSARNAGLDYLKKFIRGGYIGFIDSDDYIAPDMYEKMVARITETGADICSVGINMLNANGESIKTIIPDFGILESGEILRAYAEGLRYTRISCYLWDKLYKRDLWKCVRFPNIGTTQDRAVMPYILDTAKKAVCVSNVGCYYFPERVGNASTTFHIRKLGHAEAFAKNSSFFADKGLYSESEAFLYHAMTYCGQFYRMFDRNDKNVSRRFCELQQLIRKTFDKIPKKEISRLHYLAFRMFFSNMGLFSYLYKIMKHTA